MNKPVAGVDYSCLSTHPKCKALQQRAQQLWESVRRHTTSKHMIDTSPAYKQFGTEMQGGVYIQIKAPSPAYLRLYLSEYGVISIDWHGPGTRHLIEQIVHLTTAITHEAVMSGFTVVTVP